MENVGFRNMYYLEQKENANADKMYDVKKELIIILEFLEFCKKLNGKITDYTVWKRCIFHCVCSGECSSPLDPPSLPGKC